MSRIKRSWWPWVQRWCCRKADAGNKCSDIICIETYDNSTSHQDDISGQTSFPANSIEAMVGPVKVKVFSGDITKEKTDAIVSSTNPSLNLSSGVSGAILKAAGQSVVVECNNLGTQPSGGVVITKSGKLLTKHIIHMVGVTTYTEITSSTRKVLQMCESQKLRSVSFPAVGTGAGHLWALQVGNAMMAAVEDHIKSTKNTTLKTIHIVLFEASIIQDFEEVMKKFRKVTPKKPGDPVPIIALADVPPTESEYLAGLIFGAVADWTSYSMKWFAIVSREAVIQSPPNWTRMDNKDMDIVDIAPTSDEYKKVVTEFIKTSKSPHARVTPTIEVVKLQRIQNKGQWRVYAVRKRLLDKKYPTNESEMNLYHGTTSDICQKINTIGFNRSFCGINGTAYGKGTYFAKESWYSLQDTYSKPDAKGMKYIYRARVLVGKPCKGTGGMLEPSPLNPHDLTEGLHDCAVDDPLNPLIYVVFHDAGAYPDYLITFKTL